MSTKKSRHAIAPDMVCHVFSDVCIQELSNASKLPRDTDLKRLAKGVREAAYIYATEARYLSTNDLRREIAALYVTATRREYDRLASLIEQISPEASDLLANRQSSLRTDLPATEDLRDLGQRDKACAAIERLCRYGEFYVEGRLRPSGKRSRPSLRPLLYAPDPRRHFPKRAAERNFVMWLSMAWIEAVGSAAPRTAHRTTPGPFARFVQECLRLVGAPHANAVELINELERRRCEMERRVPLSSNKS